LKLLIPVDKANHFIAGTIICCIAIVFMIPIYALILTAVIGVFKEMYDALTNKGTPDIFDILFTIAGAIPVFLTHII
jgi:hypothetical protein